MGKTNFNQSAFGNPKVTPTLVWEGKEKQKGLVTHNKVTLIWVPGYYRIEGNAIVDELARNGSPILWLKETKSRIEYTGKNHQMMQLGNYPATITFPIRGHQNKM